MIDDRLEDTGRQVVLGLARDGGKLTLKTAAHTAVSLVGRWRAGRRVKHNTGRISEKRLQQIAGGDIHMLELSPRQARKVRKSLKQAGVRYAVERQGKHVWLHFEGQDLAHVVHAIRRALHDVGVDLRVDGKTLQQFQEQQTPQHQRNQAPQQTAPDTPSLSPPQPMETQQLPLPVEQPVFGPAPVPADFGACTPDDLVPPVWEDNIVPPDRMDDLVPPTWADNNQTMPIPVNDSTTVPAAKIDDMTLPATMEFPIVDKTQTVPESPEPLSFTPFEQADSARSAAYGRQAKPAKRTRADTLKDLRSRIDAKLAGRTGRPVMPRPRERSRGR